MAEIMWGTFDNGTKDFLDIESDASVLKIEVIGDNGAGVPGCESFDHSFPVIVIRTGRPFFGEIALAGVDVVALDVSQGFAVQPSGSTFPIPAGKGVKLVSQAGSCDNNATFNVTAI